MNPFVVLFITFVLALTVLFILNLTPLFDGIFATIVNISNMNNHNTVSQYNNAIAQYTVLTNIVVIVGFILVFVVMILYEKNR